MKPKSKAESIARANGHEYRHVYHQGPGAAKSARRFTRRQSNKAMRRHDRHLMLEWLDAAVAINPDIVCAPVTVEVKACEPHLLALARCST